ncbi:Fc.00g044440.m01.CDS01 [Cosmosporella sp. VM-42]
MHFKHLAIATAIVSASSVQAQLPAQDIVKNIDDITNLSSDTNDIAKNLGPISIFTNAPKLLNNFREIITTVTKDISAMDGMSGKTDFSESDQSGICDALRGFVKVYQDLLNTIIGKSGFISATPFTAPIGAVLRVLEGGVDKLAFGIIGTVPTCKDKATEDKNALDGALDEAIRKFT